jgi:tetratricopeptide (TPR) repeat protein
MRSKSRSHPIRVLLLLAYLALGSGCASPPAETGPATLQQAERLEQGVTAERLRRSPAPAIQDLQHALALYSLADDQAGQARCHLALARVRFLQNQPAEAIGHVAAAEQAMQGLDDAALLYQLHLLKGRLADSADDYEQALRYATQPIERAVALTYLGRIDEAHGAIRTHIDDETEYADDVGFVLYAVAKQSFDAATARQALAFYKQADNPVGIADSLYLLARIHLAADDVLNARVYLQRALVVSRALGDTRRERKLLAELEAL